jgi:ABC-2 type transport system ATP-binding protein
MISVKNLVKAYDINEPVVKGVSFTINKGEIVGLLGPNGAGKTTIMKMITCFMNPNAGEILIDNKNTLDESLNIKKLIGYLPEHTPQYEDMTVYEYLKFIGDVRGLKGNELKDAIAKMIKLTSLEDVVVKKINQLSKGYQKRVGLASVMIHDPQILILDEPTTGLDPNQVITFRKMLRQLSEKKTIILSTHILSEIEAICERVIIIKKGEIVADDTLENLIKKSENDQFIDFDIQGDSLLNTESELNKISGAWKIEFIKKVTKDIFRFRALVSKDVGFESKLNELINSKNWKLISLVKNNANLEEVFLKLAGGEE